MKTYMYRASNLKFIITFLALEIRSQFLAPDKNRRFLQFFIITIIIIQHFFSRVFSEYTEVNATSLISLDTILTEICAFIFGFSFTVWTNMRPVLAH